MNTDTLVIQLKSLFDDEGFQAMSQSLQDLDKKVKEFEEETKRLEKASLSMEKIGKAAKKMQLTVTAPIVAAGTAAVLSASKIESFTASFTTMLGNEKKADKLIKQLNQMAAITPFDPEPLIQSSKTLLAYQIELEDVESTLKMLGDASSGSAEALQSLSVAYGKIATKGKASMQELNIMIDRGVPILEYLGETLGKTGDQIIEMTSKGEISFTDINAAFKKMTSEGGVFFNGMATASETLAGKTSTLKGNINLLAAGLVEELLPIIKSTVDALNTIVVGFQNMDSSTKSAILTTAAVAAALPPVITAVASLTKGIKALTVAMKAGNMAALANPYTAIGVAIAAIVAGLAAWINKQNDIDAKVRELADKTEELGGLFDDIEKKRQNLGEKDDMQEELDAIIAYENARMQALNKTYDNLQEFLRNESTQEIRNLHEKEKEYKRVYDKIAKLRKGESGPVEIKRQEYTDWQKALIALNEEYKDTLEKSAEMKENSEITEKNLVGALAKMLKLGITSDEIRQKLNISYGSPVLGILFEMISKAIELNEELEKSAELEEKLVQETPDTAQQKKDEKDRYDRLAEIHRKYLENKKKIESDLLTATEKAALEAENRRNQAQYQEFEDYTKRIEDANKKQEVKHKVSDEERINAFRRYLDEMEDLQWGYFANSSDFYAAQEDADRLYYDKDLDIFIEYLKRKKEAKLALTADEASLLSRYETIANPEEPQKEENKLLKEAVFFEEALAVAARSFVTELETGNVTAELLGKSFSFVTDATSQIADNIADFAENMDDANAKTELIGKSIAAGLKAIGSIANEIFSAVTANIGEQMEVVSQEVAGALDKRLQELEKYYDEQQKAADAAKAASLQSLKDEYAARGIIIETGLESELEKAQAAYDAALAALEEYEDETTSTRQAQLDAYKEQLAARNDEDIQQAMEAKQRELDAVNDKKKAELQKTADTKKAELERQKILEEAEKKKNEIERQARYEKELAEFNSEVDRLNRTHALEVEQFNIKKAQDIANIWISQAAGIATIWATAMQLGPVAGPIAAGVLTGTLATVAGVQTGIIASQSPPPAPTMPTPPAKYMTGGVIPGNDNNDNTLLLASSGERVLTQEQNALFERLVQSMENGGTPPVINVSVYIDSDEINIEKKLIEIQKRDKWSGRWGM
ncbi:MAG: tape measure protein [Spirochaetales bacterium]|nr:tape measure protein [Spirochaetales bacterium]